MRRELKEDVILIRYDAYGKLLPDTISPRLMRFINRIMMSHNAPPVFTSEHISEYSSLLQKDLFFEQTVIDTKKQFEEVLERYSERKDMLFRGQNEAKWRLYSNLQREWIREKLFENEQSFELLVSALVSSGRANCGSMTEFLKNCNRVNDIAVLGYLQHLGCPTPLLDWTFSFKNALYFATTKLDPDFDKTQIGEYCSVYFIDEADFDKGGQRSLISYVLTESNANIYDNEDFTAHMIEMNRMFKTPISYFADRDLNSTIRFLIKNNKNILNQDGAFTWNSDPAEPLEMVAEKEFIASRSTTTGDYRFCKCLNIHKRLADHIQLTLSRDGITEDYVYPTPRKELDTRCIFDEVKGSRTIN